MYGDSVQSNAAGTAPRDKGPGLDSLMPELCGRSNDLARLAFNTLSKLRGAESKEPNNNGGPLAPTMGPTKDAVLQATANVREAQKFLDEICEYLF